VASTSLEVIIAGKDNLSPTLKKVEGGLGKVDKAAKSLGHTLAAGFAMGAGIAGFQGFVSVLNKMASAIPDLVQQGITFGNVIDDLTDVTGASDIAASHFAGQWEYTGGTLDNMAGKFRAATQEIKTNEAALNTLGITTKGADGRFLDTLTILENARQVYQTLPDAVTRSAFAIAFMGRTGLDATDYLRLTTDQASLLNDQLDRMGYTVENAAEFESITRETKLWDMAWQGLARSLTSAVLPALRQVLAGITEAVVTYGPQIKQVLADIINYISGVVSGLTGMNITPFQQQMDALATTTGGTVLGFEAWAAANGKVIPQLKAATGGTADLTKELDRQSAALDKQIARIKASDDAMERAFQRTMGRLADAVGDQITALDAAEKQRDIDKQRVQYAKDLADARRDLGKILSGEVVDPEQVTSARDRIRELVDASAEFERSLGIDKVRTGLEQVKTYIEDIARLEAEATNKPALVKNLATRQKVLESERAAAAQRGDIDAVAAYDAKLDAIRTAQARTQEAIRAGDKISGYETEKAKIAEVRDAQVAANADVNADTKKTLAELKTQYDTYVEGTKTKLAEAAWAMNNVNLAAFGFPEGTTIPQGAVSPLSQAFIDGASDAVKLRDVLVEVADGAGKFAQSMLNAYTWLSDIFTKLKPPDWFETIINFPNPLELLQQILSSGIPEPPSWWPGQGGDGTMPKYPIRAAGGPVSAYGAYTVGERGPETLVMGGSGGYIVPNGGGVIETTVILDGEVVGRSVDRYLARRARL
jgi:hypothetical protein